MPNIFAFIMVLFQFFASFALFSQKVATSSEFLETGMHHFNLQEYDSALYYFNTLIATDSSNAEVWFRRALVKEKLSDLNGANQDYRIAIKINPKPVYFNNIGINMGIMGYHEEAIAEYNKALFIDSLYVQAIFNKGIAHHYLGNFDKACLYVKKARIMGLMFADNYINEYCK